jgi:hypothetical protein
MTRFRVAITALWVVGMAVILAVPVTADMYYYRDDKGQLHLTNVFSKIPLAYRSRVVEASKPRGRPVSSTPETKEAAELPQPAAVAPQPAPAMAPPAANGFSAAAVSTHQFGLLRLRMSDFAVMQRLGQPAAITDVSGLTSHLQRPGRVIRVVRGETWYYPGNTSVPPTRLEFSNGRLVQKQRLHP